MPPGAKCHGGGRNDRAVGIQDFQVNGVMVYVDPYGKVMGYEDIFTKIDMCRKHYAEVGLGEDYVDQFIR